MNVIKYDIEVKRSFFDFEKKLSVSELINKSFENDLEIKENLKSEMELEWNQLSLKQVVSLNASSSIIGYSTTKNIRIFFFEKKTTGLRSKNNVSIEIIAFGDLEVEVILNETFSKAKKILSELKCNHIDGSKLLIYPYDTKGKDIYSYELKVKADVKSPMNVSKDLIWKWILTFVVVIVATFLSTTNKTQADSAGFKASDILPLIIKWGWTYLAIDVIVYLIVQATKLGKKTVTINNLSSFIEKGDDAAQVVPTSVNFQIPK